MNQIAFYYRKDLNVTKHGEYKAGADMKMGDAVKRDESTGTIVLATNSDDFEGIVDILRWNVQGNDSLEITSGERCRIGVGVDYEFVIKDGTYLDAIAEGTELEVANGKFVALATGKAVGKLIKKFISGEKVIRIY